MEMIGSNLNNRNGESYPDLGDKENKLKDSGLNFGAYAPTESASLGSHRVNAIWAVHGERTVIRTRHSRNSQRGGVSLQEAGRDVGGKEHSRMQGRVALHACSLSVCMLSLLTCITFCPSLKCTEYWLQRLNVDSDWDLFHAIRDTRDCEWGNLCVAICAGRRDADRMGLLALTPRHV